MKIAIHLSSKYPLTYSNTLVVWVDFDTLYLLSCLLYHFIYMDRDREGGIHHMIRPDGEGKW